MYTRCSECETLFRVTREQLNAARGRVRCGRCGNVFDALSSLHEEFAPLPGEAEARHDGGAAPTFEYEPAATHEDADFDESRREGAAPTFEYELAAASPIPDADVGAAPLRRDEEADDAPPPFLLVDDRRKRWPWVLLAFVAVFALGAQLVHMNRAALVEHEDFRPLITRAYDALQLPLGVPLRYDLNAFALLHHELASHPRRGGALHFSGVLSNEAEFAQPWPVLELRLEDRFGDLVAARRLRPDEYLRNPPSLNERMPPHARRAIEVELVDPGRDAVGFSINFCAEIDRVLRCAATTSASD